MSRNCKHEWTRGMSILAAVNTIIIGSLVYTALLIQVGS